MNFTKFGFDDRLMEGIEASNYKTATPIQAQAIPHVLQGKDLLAIAQTGTGKTAAFLLPLINRALLQSPQPQGIQGMVIVPTRELAIQVAQQMEGLSYFTGISSIAIYGGGDGNDFVQEKRALTAGAEFIICTPGKMMAHIKMGYVNLATLKYLVLDEADRMLDMGFYDDIMFIINKIPKKRQTLLFSATMPPKIRTLSKNILHHPVEVNIAISKPPEKIEQKAFLVDEEQKNNVIQQLLRSGEYKVVLIFCGSKQSVKQLARQLRSAGITAGEIHSDLEQGEREDMLIGYKSGRVKVLVATDILSRGIDIDNIDLVINYDVPRNGEDYVHRIGRTARAEAGGTAVTLVSRKDQYKFRLIEQLLGREIEKKNFRTAPTTSKQSQQKPGAKNKQPGKPPYKEKRPPKNDDRKEA